MDDREGGFVLHSKYFDKLYIMKGVHVLFLIIICTEANNNYKMSSKKNI